jgi:hypothetical protein
VEYHTCSFVVTYGLRDSFGILGALSHSAAGIRRAFGILGALFRSL